MATFDTLRENLEALEDAGHLRRVSKPINKDSEMMPLVRCQFRGLSEEQRTGWLFEHPTDDRNRDFDIPAAVSVVGASREMYRFNLGCETDAETVEKWNAALDNPIEPVERSDARIKDVILEGQDLEGPGNGIDVLPVPISTPGFDPAPFLTSGYVITEDPETGTVNMGTYRCHIKSSDKMGVWFAPHQDLQTHWDKARERGEPLEGAIVLGAPPHISVVSVSKVPSAVNELAVSGGLVEEPVEVVEGETVDVRVPACAEIVIEGEFTMDRHTEGPFGEFTGYMGEVTQSPDFEVSCITHTENPVYQAFFSQMPPSESSLIRKVGNEQSILSHLQNIKGPEVKDVVLHQHSGSVNFLVIQIEKTKLGDPWQALYGTMGYTSSEGKFTVVVDPDIDPNDLRSVIWAMSFRVQPSDDVEIANYRNSPLDPGSAPFDVPKEERSYPGRKGDSAVLIDATMPWDYPPTSLPKREFMERAFDIWDELELPELELVEPWYGVSFGAWTESREAAADAAVAGEYLDYDTEQIK